MEFANLHSPFKDAVPSETLQLPFLTYLQAFYPDFFVSLSSQETGPQSSFSD